MKGEIGGEQRGAGLHREAGDDKCARRRSPRMRCNAKRGDGVEDEEQGAPFGKLASAHVHGRGGEGDARRAHQGGEGGEDERRTGHCGRLRQKRRSQRRLKRPLSSRPAAPDGRGGACAEAL